MTTSPTDFNPANPTVMHLDLNSAFATIEQQANPFLRNKPVAVAAYDSPGGCILASSIEAKRVGIKTGFRVKDAKRICPHLIVLQPDPDKYRHVHLQFRQILSHYTNDFYPKSIDEFVLHFAGYPAFKLGLKVVARQIKSRIKSEIGGWLTVSIGISTNRILAKLASNLNKPDGLDQIDRSNYLSIYQNLKLTDLHGINLRNESRLRGVGIHSVLDFYHADRTLLKAAFRSILANYWHTRLRGYEVDDLEFARRTFGNSFALPHHSGSKAELFPILQKLVEKTGSRLRASGYQATGVHLGLLYKNGTYWHQGKTLKRVIFDSRDIYREMLKLLARCPHTNPVHTISETCFGLVPSDSTQLELFEDVLKKQSLVDAIDNINQRWGSFVVTPARMILAGQKVQDRIAFGNVREL